MALKRILPCLLYNGKGLVKTIQFKNPGYVGDPINAIKIFNEKEVDELVVLDINATKEQRGPNFSKIAPTLAVRILSGYISCNRLPIEAKLESLLNLSLSISTISD